MQHTTSIARATRLTTSRMATPPPTILSPAFPAGLGWIDGQTIGFRGFSDEQQVSRAAAVAYRAMEKRLTGGRWYTRGFDVHKATVERRGDVEFITVGKRPIARLVRLGSIERNGDGSLGFELQVPVPVNEPTLRDIAAHIYSEVRRSGVSWGKDPRVISSRKRPRAEVIDHWIRTRLTGILATIVVVFGVVVVAAAWPTFAGTIIAPALVGMAVVIVAVGLGGLIGMMMSDREVPIPLRWGAEKPVRHMKRDTRFWYSGGGMAST